MATTTLLGSVGINYIRDQLSHGKTLSRLVAANIGDQYSAIALVPGLIGSQRLTQFDIGGASSPGSAQFAMNRLGEVIESALNAGSVCILENPLAERTDKATKHNRSHLVFHEKEVYHVLASVNKNDISTTTILKEGRSSYANGFIIEGPGVSIPVPTDQLSKRELDKWARQVEVVFVGAYDGEGFVIACKPGSSITGLLLSASGTNLKQ
jgi:hypothetical protein